MNNDALLLSNVSVQLGGVPVLTGINAAIAPGELIGVFGPNGSGKTTLMRVLLGLLPIRSGAISLFDKAPGALNHQIGYMPQASQLPEATALSARSLVMAVQGGHRWGMPWSSVAAAREVDEVLALADASELADAPFHKLSGGEKQRILLAQALLGKPRLLLLDEPLASLDPYHQMKLVQCIDNIKKTTGATILFIAHDINPLINIMDRILYLAGGSAALGTVEEIISNEVLSKLYNATMHVIRAEGHIFIVNAAHPQASCKCY